MYIRIKKLREKNGFSAKEIANFLCITEKLYQSFENGKKRIPVNILSELSKKYNTSIDYLIGNTDTQISHKKINS